MSFHHCKVGDTIYIRKPLPFIPYGSIEQSPMVIMEQEAFTIENAYELKLVQADDLESLGRFRAIKLAQRQAVGNTQ